jgi:hypothetical protein
MLFLRQEGETMDNLASSKRFRSLLDAVAADSADFGPVAGDNKALGPCVGDDSDAPRVMALGPSVGDDGGPGLTMLGPSVGDDTPESDVRLKENVQRVGTTVFGLPLYQFKYLGRPETYEGVMAHEVLQVMPDAVSRGEDGYYRVNYSALGTSMRRVS